MEQQNLFESLISAILAGICISLGGFIFLSVENPIIGSFLFSIGLFCVCTGGLNLFTGRVCYFLDYSGRHPWLILPIIIFGNASGCALTAKLISMTRHQNIMQKAADIMQIKANDSFLSLFILAILCNVFIYIAVEGYRELKDIGRYLAIVFGVMGFILCGTEHCVADLFYFYMSGLSNRDINLLGRIAIIILGNTVGGLLAQNIHYYIKNKEEI